MAALLLSIMVLPTIMVLSEDALRKVADQRQRANALGLSWWAVGKTVAVMLIIGSIDRLPEPLYNLLQPAQSLTSLLGVKWAKRPSARPTGRH